MITYVSSAHVMSGDERVTRQVNFKMTEIVVAPNGALSIHDVMSRYTRGQAVPSGGLEPVYSPAIDYDNMSKLDKAEALKKVKAKIAQINDKFKHDADAASKAAAAAVRKADIDAAIAADRLSQFHKSSSSAAPKES